MAYVFEFVRDLLGEPEPTFKQVKHCVRDEARTRIKYLGKGQDSLILYCHLARFNPRWLGRYEAWVQVEQNRLKSINARP